MSKTNLTLQLGGVERGFRLRNRTINVIGELENMEDPLQFTPKSSTWADIKEYATVILHAGLVTDAEQTGQKVDFSREDIRRWMDEDLTPADIYLIADMYRDCMNPKILTANGGAAEKRGQASNVAGV
jgi:hypothetical protein